MKFTIDRSKWIRGEGWHNTCLYRPKDDKLCCLGFFSLACGLTKEDIANKKAPRDIEDKLHLYPDWALEVDLYDQGTFLNYIIDVNDELSKYISEEDREKELTNLFSNLGIEVEFIDGR